MGRISRQTLQRLYAICLVAAYRDGAYGRLRLHKVNFFAERDSDLRPFTIHFDHFGQFSHGLADTLEQLLGMQHLSAYSKPGSAENEVNIYRVRDALSARRYRAILAMISPQLLRGLDLAVEQYGYLSETNLRREAYKFLQGVSEGDVVVEEALPDTIEIPGLSDEECDDLELTLSPNFLQAMKLVKDGLRASKLDLEKVRVIAELPTHS